jgi:hypothetical protein
VIESLIIDARFEWFSISNGDCQPVDIMGRWRALAKLLNETESKFFPDGIPAKNRDKGWRKRKRSPILTTSIGSETLGMAFSWLSRPSQKIVRLADLGKSTLIGPLEISIPMPLGVKPTRAPSMQELAYDDDGCGSDLPRKAG